MHDGAESHHRSPLDICRILEKNKGAIFALFMSTTFLIWTFFASVLGIAGIFGEYDWKRKREAQRKIEAALTKKDIIEKTMTPPAQDALASTVRSAPSASATGAPSLPEDFSEKKEAATTSPHHLSSQEIRSLFNRAEVLLARESFKEAEKLFIKILAFDPAHMKATQKLAFLYLQTESYPKAETLYRQMVELSPDTPAVYTNLGLALFHQKKFDEAIEAYRQAIELEPERGARYANLGQVFFVIKDTEAAIDCFTEAVKKDSRNLDFLYLLADALLEANHFVDAKKSYERILDISPYDEAAKEEVRRLSALGF